MSSRRTFSPEFKAQRVLEVLTGAKTAAEVCRDHKLKADLLSRWKASFVQNAPKLFQSDEAVDPDQARIAELDTEPSIVHGLVLGRAGDRRGLG